MACFFQEPTTRSHSSKPAQLEVDLGSGTCGVFWSRSLKSHNSKSGSPRPAQSARRRTARPEAAGTCNPRLGSLPPAPHLAAREARPRRGSGGRARGGEEVGADAAAGGAAERPEVLVLAHHLACHAERGRERVGHLRPRRPRRARGFQLEARGRRHARPAGRPRGGARGGRRRGGSGGGRGAGCAWRRASEATKRESSTASLSRALVNSSTRSAFRVLSAARAVNF